MSLSELAKKSGDAIAIHYVPLDDLADTFLDGNSKKHDVEKLIESIRRYGFRDPIAFDSNLNNGAGGIIEGNGRLEALIEMRSQGMNLPRGLSEGWKVPTLFGVNANSEAEAIAFSVEHNWSVLWGGEVDLESTLSLFDNDALTEQLEKLNKEQSLPISINDDLAELLSGLNNDKIPDDEDWDFIADKIPDEDKGDFAQMTFTLSSSQIVIVKEAIAQCEDDKSSENKNKNGNSLTAICKFFLENGNG